MTESSPVNFILDDKDLDDAALWAAIDSAAASLSSSITTTTTPQSKPHHHHKPPVQYSPVPYPSPLLNLPKNPKSRHHHSPDGEVLHEHWDVQNHRPSKIARSCPSELSETTSPPPPPPLAMVKHVQRTPTTPSYCSPEARRLFDGSPLPQSLSYGQSEEGQSTIMHSLAGRFPSVSLFKEYQNAAMAILEKGDYTMISGTHFIKKSGWRKISFYFNLSYEIKDKTIEFDDNRNVQRAEFVVRAYMQGGRFSDGWGSCERREKRFLKPNHDIPSTAETRAKNKACQDLLGIGEYRPGVHAQR